MEKASRRLTGTDEAERQTVLGTGQDVSVSDNWSIKGQTEGLRVHDVDTDELYYDGSIYLGATWRQQYSATVTYEATGQKNPPDGRSKWIKLDLRAFVANKYELLMTIGQERGGLVCSSGKCRVVTPFNGVKMTFTTLF